MVGVKLATKCNTCRKKKIKVCHAPEAPFPYQHVYSNTSYRASV